VSVPDFHRVRFLKKDYPVKKFIFSCVAVIALLGITSCANDREQPKSTTTTTEESTVAPPQPVSNTTTTETTVQKN